MNIAKTLCLFLCVTGSAVYAGSPFDVPQNPVAPVPLRTHKTVSSLPAVFPNEFRSIDGSGNNPINPLRGSASIPFLRRMLKADYGENSPASGVRRSARSISNLIVSQDHMVPSPARASDYLWQWGQFIDHDMDLTTGRKSSSNPSMSVPLGDPRFDPNSTGTHDCDGPVALHHHQGRARSR